jgi:predicted regulator of Ras-like GTPase activity (Roadblock/LC7/MglB family)
MPVSSLVIFDEELKQITGVIDRLCLDADAKGVFLIDKDGQLITSSGETKDIDTTSLASLAAGNIAATGGLAKLIGEKEFSILFHEGEKDNIHISIVSQRLILVVIFDDRSSLGLVRLRVRKANEELNTILERLIARASETQSTKENLLTEITDDEIEKLFQ